jgi:hypothetical protein
MGLDMYLHAKRFVWHNETEAATKALTPLFPEAAGFEIKGVEIEAAYWRKANAIHGWFVKHCQGGVDECQETEVSKEQLTALKDACLACLEDPAKIPDLLPPQEGFFFGGTEIDSYYITDLQDTVITLDKILKNEALLKWDFFYRSSW